MTNVDAVIWMGLDGRTHAAVGGRSYTFCFLDTGNLIRDPDGDPIKDGVTCETCAAKISTAIAMLLAAFEGVLL